MDLREYLFRKDMTEVEFAKRINYSRNYISQVARKRLIPGVKFILIVEKATNGEVCAGDLLKQYKESKN